MRYIILILFLPLFLKASYLKPTLLKIYQNDSYLKKDIFLENDKESEILIKTPDFVSLEDIKINLQKDCRINDLFLQKRLSFNDSLNKEIEEIEKKINIFQNKIKSLDINNKLLESVEFKKIQNCENIKDIVSFQQKSIFDNLNEIYLLREKIKKLNDRLNELNNKRESGFYKVFVLKLSCNEAGRVGSLEYPIRVERRNRYDIKAFYKRGLVLIKNILLISQKSGEDLNNITLILSSYPRFEKIAPKNFYPWYLNIYKRPPMALKKEVFQKAPSSFAPKIEYKKDEFKEYYEIKNVSLKNGVEKSVSVSKKEYKAKRYIEIDGYGYAKAFVTFEFDLDRFYNDAKARFFLDDFFVGYGYFKASKKHKKLYFGEDLKTKVDKKLVKDFSKEPIFSSNKVKITKIWVYLIKNNHKSKTDIKLVERVPVSKNEKIEVETIAKPKYTKLYPNGKVVWDFSLMPKEEKKITFGYSIEKPKDYLWR